MSFIGNLFTAFCDSANYVFIGVTLFFTALAILLALEILLAAAWHKLRRAE